MGDCGAYRSIVDDMLQGQGQQIQCTGAAVVLRMHSECWIQDSVVELYDRTVSGTDNSSQYSSRGTKYYKGSRATDCNSFVELPVVSRNSVATLVRVWTGVAVESFFFFIMICSVLASRLTTARSYK